MRPDIIVALSYLAVPAVRPVAPVLPVRIVASSALRVGDLVLLEKNARVPADMLLLRTRDSSGTCFVRTDQLDGETDWKLRVAVPSTQSLSSDRELIKVMGGGSGEGEAQTKVRKER